MSTTTFLKYFDSITNPRIEHYKSEREGLSTENHAEISTGHGRIETRYK